MAKEEAARVELADLLDMNPSSNLDSTAIYDNNSSSFIGSTDISKNTKKKRDPSKNNLSSLDKVYLEMKQKNKKLKKEIIE